MILSCNPHWKGFAKLLPNYWLAENPTGACFDAAWQTVGGKGADLFNQLNF
ncbi:hypothetical protein [Peribacillus sp. AS_2]|uniref:hypothetical protein n=1 Tax=Peribacillus sp. AS_2 TaxID=2996755 RepID=UPI0022A6A3DC|nr:hypothetical protein [Peribacillus sp. AS_2]MCZ0875399.1 hypothetical protein [Peribacillus sp. AS_2]